MIKFNDLKIILFWPLQYCLSRSTTIHVYEVEKRENGEGEGDDRDATAGGEIGEEGEDEEGSVEHFELECSEEELCEDKDDGFQMDDDRPRRKIGDVLERWKKIVDSKKSMSIVGGEKVGSINGAQSNNTIEEHEIDEEYNSEDLDSDVEGQDNFSKYKVHDMCNSFKFKLGMEFCSLKDAKQAIKEHVVLNG